MTYRIYDGDNPGYERTAAEDVGTVAEAVAGAPTVGSPILSAAQAARVFNYVPPPAVSASGRYVRVLRMILDLGMTNGYTTELSEIEIMVGGVNVAPGKTSTPSLPYLRDGAKNIGGDVDDVVIDLGETKTIDEVILSRSTINNSYASTYRVLLSDDGSLWTPFGKDVTWFDDLGNQTSSVTVTKGTAVAYRYWRIDQCGSVGSWAGSFEAGELEMYLDSLGPAAPALHTPANKALGATVLASSPHRGSGSGSQAVLFDGVNGGSGWWDTCSFSEYMEFDIGASRAIKAIQWLPAGYVTGLRLQARNSLSDPWTTVGKLSFRAAQGARMSSPYGSAYYNNWNIQG